MWFRDSNHACGCLGGSSFCVVFLCGNPVLWVGGIFCVTGPGCALMNWVECSVLGCPISVCGRFPLRTFAR